MVNFGDNFRHSIYANWVSYYVDYEQLQKLIYSGASASVFEEALTREVKKCNAFLVRRAGRIRDQLDHLKGFQGAALVNEESSASNADSLLVGTPSSPNSPNGDQRLSEWDSGRSTQRIPSMNSRKSQKRALVDLYRQQIRLETFKMLNYTACVKILKKFDKCSPAEAISSKVLQALKREPFLTMTLLKESKDELEVFFAAQFCDNNTMIARTQLKLKQNVAGYWQLFQLGVRTGAAVVLLMWCLWDCLVDDAKRHNLWVDPVMSVSTII
jgi:SPX domain protein involved in polyphosphate accumulation